MKGKIKKITTIVITAIIFFTMGVALPIVVKGENGDANAAQVLAGKTFTSSLVSVATSGEMKNLSGKTFATNNPGVSTIDVDDGYYTEIQVDASAVYDAGVAAGEENGITLQDINPDCELNAKYWHRFTANNSQDILVQGYKKISVNCRFTVDARAYSYLEFKDGTQQLINLGLKSYDWSNYVDIPENVDTIRIVPIGTAGDIYYSLLVNDN